VNPIIAVKGAHKMSEELLQRDFLTNPERIGEWAFYNIGSTTINALKNHGIIPKKDYKDIERRKPDGIIVRDKKVIVVVENKKPSELKTKKQIIAAVKQGIDVATSLDSILLIVTDTVHKTIWINAANGELILEENGTPIALQFNLKNEAVIKKIQKIIDCISVSNSQFIKPKFIDPSPLAKKIWQDVWSVSGATPENCLYTFVELFIFKYLSDLNILQNYNSFNFLIEQYSKESDDRVLEYYANNVRPEIKRLFPKSDKDKTTIINGTIFVSKDEKAVSGYSAVFRKILLKFAEEGKLENIHYDFKSKLFESFLKESISKKNWGQFFTPLKVVQSIVKMVEIKEGMTICDPACGVGKFLLEPIIQNIDRFFPVESGKLTPKIQIVGYDKGFDKDEQKTIILAKANMLIYFADVIKRYPQLAKEFSDLFNDSFELKINSILGTLSSPVQNKYDLILTNPPYVTSGSSNIKEEIKKSGLEYSYPLNSTGVEGLFMQWIVEALKPGGKAFVVVPDGLLTRDNDSKLREFLIEKCFIDAVFSLPSKTFFSTMKKTYIFAFTKKHSIDEVQIDPIFTHLSKDIGETLDIYRLDQNQNDLSDGATMYNQFKGAKHHFKSHDLRCRIVDFEWFQQHFDKSWRIEQLWSDKELIELGVKSAEKSITIKEFSEYLTELTETIESYSQRLVSITGSITNIKSLKLTDKNYFELITGGLGYKKSTYAPLDTKEDTDIPVYTAALKPVAYFKKGSIKRMPLEPSECQPHISFASDGDGTAATNIVLHFSPYYINTSRISFKVVDPAILPDFIYYSIQDIKRKYGFDYKHKATLNNLHIIEIEIPLNNNGKFDLEKQKEFADCQRLITEIKKELNEKLKNIIETKVSI
jgi:type I restriction-modification system DNA methylase subunit